MIVKFFGKQEPLSWKIVTADGVIIAAFQYMEWAYDFHHWLIQKETSAESIAAAVGEE